MFHSQGRPWPPRSSGADESDPAGIGELAIGLAEAAGRPHHAIFEDGAVEVAGVVERRQLGGREPAGLVEHRVTQIVGALLEARQGGELAPAGDVPHDEAHVVQGRVEILHVLLRRRVDDALCRVPRGLPSCEPQVLVESRAVGLEDEAADERGDQGVIRQHAAQIVHGALCLREPIRPGQPARQRQMSHVDVGSHCDGLPRALDRGGMLAGQIVGPGQELHPDERLRIVGVKPKAALQRLDAPAPHGPAKMRERPG